MAGDDPPPPVEALTRASRESWDRNAAYWDERMGEGNEFQRLLLAPALERLLQLRRGQRVLEIACGNGQFARRMAALGAQVVAVDFSAEMIERARARSRDSAGRVSYRVVDATDPAQLLSLPGKPFDAAVCNMALMDMAAIEPLAAALRELVKAGGPFVFSVEHPCFKSLSSTLVAERVEGPGEVQRLYSVKVSRYKTPFTAEGVAMEGQPALQVSFHRPLEVLFGAFFEAGLALDGLEEPVFPPSAAPDAAPRWSNLTEIPPVLVARMRLPG